MCLVLPDFKSCEMSPWDDLYSPSVLALSSNNLEEVENILLLLIRRDLIHFLVAIPSFMLVYMYLIYPLAIALGIWLLSCMSSNSASPSLYSGLVVVRG
jgi:hypothetical protein